MGKLSLQMRRALARGLNARTARAFGNRVTLSKVEGSGGPGNRAYREVGSGNSRLGVFAKAPGTGGNSVTFAIVVSGASTPLSIGVTGNAITVNSKTTAGSAASSTAAEVVSALKASAAASALVHAYLPKGSDGSGTVAASGATALAGGS